MSYIFVECAIFHRQKILFPYPSVLLYLGSTLVIWKEYSALLWFHNRIYHKAYTLARCVFGTACYTFVAHCTCNRLNFIYITYREISAQLAMRLHLQVASILWLMISYLANAPFLWDICYEMTGMLGSMLQIIYL